MKDKKKVIFEYMKQNTLSIFILICIVLYMITRWGFSKDTIDYRIDSHNERVELNKHIDVLETKISDLTDEIDELENQLYEFHNMK